MKSPRRKPRTIIGLFFCLWFFYVFLRWRNKSDSVEGMPLVQRSNRRCALLHPDIEAKLSGQPEPEIVAKQVNENTEEISSGCGGTGYRDRFGR